MPIIEASHFHLVEKYYSMQVLTNEQTLILTLLFILLTTYNLEDKNNFNSEIKIKNIIVENNSILKGKIF